MSTDVVEADTDRPEIVTIRGQGVVLDYDLASRLGVETSRLNQQTKRNIERFPADWAFQLTAEEFAAVKADSTNNHGGRRKPPWVYSEHGVVMAASLLRSPAAVQAMQFVVEVFIQARRAGFPNAKHLLPPQVPTQPAPANPGLSARLKDTIERLMETVTAEQITPRLRDEAISVMREAVDSIKERLKKPGVENDEIAARATKYLAEAEMAKATAAKTHAETKRIDFDTLVRKLRLVMSAELLLESGDVRSFVGMLEDLGRSNE